ncbi:hypothetical protein POG22_03705 [Geitlerinema sp. CS-897]|nr:hypothetical protein [Cyanobacteria bacterium SID2]MBP0003704.1 hypothetical protein [Cyanobacteria bacterium SBC]MDC0832115.1 hypothetical protein [Geitlerinema sp. CS-897]
MTGSTPPLYEEIVNFIALGTTPDRVANFQPSDTAKQRVAQLIEREKDNEIAADERTELDLYLQLEHIMRLAKIRARQHLAASRG